jgi:hypothetical protein
MQNWTMYRLVDKLIELNLMEPTSDESIHQIFKKPSNPGRSACGVFWHRVTL